MSGPATGGPAEPRGAAAGAGRFGWRWVVPVAVALVAAVPWLIVAGDVPDPLATHFGPSGWADGSMSHELAAVFLGGFLVAGLAWLVWAQRHGPRFAAILAAYFSGLMALASLATAAVNQGIDRWEDAHLAWGWVIVVTLGGVPFAALAGWLQPPDTPTPRSAPAVPLPLTPTELVVWVGRAQAGPALWLPILALVGLAVAGLFGVAAGWLLATALFMLAALLCFTSVRVRVDERGVEVRPGLVPWPRVSFPLATIETARAEVLAPREWGGWGYRGSLRLARRAAWVLRSGEALVLDLDGDRRFAVTVDGAPEAASVINGLLTRRTDS